MKPVCPHCRQELSFTKALKIGNPFFFNCPLCNSRIKQFTFGLLFQALLVVLLTLADVFWMVHEIAQGHVLRALLSIFVLVSGLLSAEYFTYRYLSKHGVLKNGAP